MTLMEEEIREQFGIEMEGPGGYEIVTISVGTGNGWEFSADVLKASLALWDGVECFIDHNLNQRSVRDIAGVIKEPEWDENEKAIRALLKPMGPSAGLLKDIGKEMVDGGDDQAKVGFSADMIFTGRNKKVEKIVKVNSVDLVYNPARGGKFVRSLNNNENGEMLNSNEFSTTEAVRDRSSVGNWKNEEGGDMREEMEKEENDLASELDQVKKLREQMSEWTLEMGLQRSKLPKGMQEMVKKQFSKREFTG